MHYSITSYYNKKNDDFSEVNTLHYFVRNPSEQKMMEDAYKELLDEGQLSSNLKLIITQTAEDGSDLSCDIFVRAEPRPHVKCIFVFSPSLAIPSFSLSRHEILLGSGLPSLIRCHCGSRSSDTASCIVKIGRLLSAGSSIIASLPVYPLI